MLQLVFFEINNDSEFQLLASKSQLRTIEGLLVVLHTRDHHVDSLLTGESRGIKISW